jgi:C4-dicarboxylate-specific signal transduction histidine kinase
MVRNLEIVGISKSNDSIICEVTVCRVSHSEAVIFCRDIRERKTMEIRRKHYTETLEREVMSRTLELEESKKQLEYELDLLARGSKNLTESLDLAQNGR